MLDHFPHGHISNNTVWYRGLNEMTGSNKSSRTMSKTKSISISKTNCITPFKESIPYLWKSTIKHIWCIFHVLLAREDGTEESQHCHKLFQFWLRTVRHYNIDNHQSHLRILGDFDVLELGGLAVWRSFACAENVSITCVAMYESRVTLG